MPKSKEPPAKRLRKAPAKGFSETPRSKLGKQNVKLYQTFNQQVGQSAEAILNLTIPSKIMHLHRLVGDIPSRFEQVVPLSPSPNQDEAAADPKDKQPPTKRKKKSNKKDPKPEYSESSSDSESDSEGDAAKPRRGCSVPQNSSVQKVIAIVKDEVRDLIHFVSILKLNIQLRVPQVEDGGNHFGVGVQEEAVGELNAVEDAGYSYLELLPSYYASRAQLTACVLKYPGVLDYRLAIAGFDEQFFLKFQLCVTELRNQYLRVFDLLIKNQEKIKDPQGANHSSFMR